MRRFPFYSNNSFFVAVTCNTIPFVQNAVSTPNFGPVQCNAAVTYRCNAGYTLQGQGSLTCSSTGQLTGTAPTCTQGTRSENCSKVKCILQYILYYTLTAYNISRTKFMSQNFCCPAFSQVPGPWASAECSKDWL